MKAKPLLIIALLGTVTIGILAWILDNLRFDSPKKTKTASQNALTEITPLQTTLNTSYVEVFRDKEGTPPLSYILKHDYQHPYSYVGKAPWGRIESEAVWTITRITINSDGTTITELAPNSIWNDRETLTYS